MLIYLTHAWINFTYGKKELEENMIDRFCDDWPFAGQSQIFSKRGGADEGV